jgi:ABC-type Fe3+-hydroxamate transport system substrate-binding protein
MRTRVFDAAGVEHAKAERGARIVSLVPSITELLFALKLDAQIVGRTGFCVHPRDKVRRVPKVGGTKAVKIDAVRALQPTHVIVNIDENERETVEQLREFVPHVVVTHPQTPHDNLSLYALLGAIFDRDKEAQRLAAMLQARLHEAASRAFAAQNVLYLIWREPWMTVARMHAEAGAPDDLPFEAESKQQFGDARHQRDDARTGTRFLVRDAGCIDRTQ